MRALRIAGAFVTLVVAWTVALRLGIVGKSDQGDMALLVIMLVVIGVLFFRKPLKPSEP